MLGMESVGAVLRSFDRVRLHRLRKTVVIICFQARVNWKLQSATQLTERWLGELF